MTGPFLILFISCWGAPKVFFNYLSFLFLFFLGLLVEGATLDTAKARSECLGTRYPTSKAKDQTIPWR